MLKATAGKVLPTTITGSLPRPSWYTENLGNRSFLDAMVISRFREQYTDALSVYLTEQELTSSEWLGTDGKPGNVAQNLQSAAQFLTDQKQIPAAPDLAAFQKALYVKGLPGVLAS